MSLVEAPRSSVQGYDVLAAPYMRAFEHSHLQESAWLVRHAAMDSLVEALRSSSNLDPRTLVPPCLLPQGETKLDRFTRQRPCQMKGAAAAT